MAQDMRIWSGKDELAHAKARRRARRRSGRTRMTEMRKRATRTGLENHPPVLYSVAERGLFMWSQSMPAKPQTNQVDVRHETMVRSWLKNCRRSLVSCARSDRVREKENGETRERTRTGMSSATTKAMPYMLKMMASQAHWAVQLLLVRRAELRKSWV